MVKSKSLPEHKIREDDEGDLAIRIITQDGTIIIDFSKSITWIGFSPEDARKIAYTLNKVADEIEENMH